MIIPPLELLGIESSSAAFALLCSTRDARGLFFFLQAGIEQLRNRSREEGQR